MRTFKLCGCLLVSMLLVRGGCHKGEQTLVPKVVPAVINNCNVSPDPVLVHQGDKIDWEPGDNLDYTIEFLDHKEPTLNPFPVNHGHSNPEHLIKGHNRCKQKPDGYYCKYTVIGSAPGSVPGSPPACTNTNMNDPGVHIIQ